MKSKLPGLVELTDLNNDLLLPWLDLYETALPANERELVSSQIGLLKAKMQGDAEEHVMLAAVNDQEKLVGLIQYEYNQQLSVALLWYFAIKVELRNKGLGSQIYRELASRLAANGIQTLIYEVEIPEEATSDENRQLAKRRIEFYRRLGGKVLTGIHYLQYVGWHEPPTPMHLMIHSRQALNAQSAYELAKKVFNESLEQTGSLTLE